MSRRSLFPGIVFLAVLSAAAYLAPEPEPVRSADPESLFWYCPACGLKMTCPPGAENEETLCPHCRPKPVVLEVHGAAADGGGSWFPGSVRWAVIGICGVLIVLSVGLCLFGGGGRRPAIPQG
jgi:hypothetical protein